MDKVLIIFVKYPQAGRVKTRLAKSIGKDKAACLYKEFVQDTISQTRSSRYRQVIFYTPKNKRQEISQWLGNDLSYYSQEGKDLGQRMYKAFDLILKVASSQAVIIGSDSPLINKRNIARAFKVLERKDCVIGPAQDGGYYLLGLKKPNKDIFKNIDWSTDRVLNQTLKLLTNRKISYSLIEPGFDVDTAEDLARLDKPYRL